MNPSCDVDVSFTTTNITYTVWYIYSIYSSQALSNAGRVLSKRGCWTKINTRSIESDKL